MKNEKWQLENGGMRGGGKTAAYGEGDKDEWEKQMEEILKDIKE